MSQAAGALMVTSILKQSINPNENKSYYII